MGDFWGYKSTNFRMRNNEKGISLVLLNSEKGKQMFVEIYPNIRCIKKSLKEAMSGNRSLKEPRSKNLKSDEFWEEFINNDNLMELYSRYCLPYRFPMSMKINWFILNHLYLIPKYILRKRGLIE